MSKTRANILTALFVSILLLTATAFTYAFYGVNVSNANKQSATITTGTMKLTFADNDTGVNASLNFGDSVTKLFTIENTGNTDAIGKMQWSNLVNTYTLGSLTYTLSYSNAQAGVYTDIITNKSVPKSATAVTEDLANGLSVPAGVKYYYKLVITLNSLDDVDQTSDINASFGTKFTMVQGTPDYLNTHIASLTETDGVYNENGYRYEGANPNNYITFNNETWRIIGVFNTLLADGTTTKPLVKIIKDDSIGYYPFDNSTDISSYGSNAWERLDGTKATVNTLLNTYYYNSSDGSSLSLGNWTSTGLNETSRGLIEEVTWNLGGTDSSLTAGGMYTAERTALSGTAATYNKSVTTGKLGLMYVSDYLYSAPESTCARTTSMNSYSGSGCYGNSWIYKAGKVQWTLSPYSSNGYGVWLVNGAGYVFNYYADCYGYVIRPVLYLNSSAYIVSGDGTSGNPYVINI